MNSICEECFKEINIHLVYEYKDKELCTNCISHLARLEKNYKVERENENEEYDNCSLCGKLYFYLIEGEFNDKYCVKCAGSEEMPRGEGYRLALWSRYLDKQQKTHDAFYDFKRFK